MKTFVYFQLRSKQRHYKSFKKLKIIANSVKVFLVKYTRKLNAETVCQTPVKCEMRMTVTYIVCKGPTAMNANKR